MKEFHFLNNFSTCDLLSSHCDFSSFFIGNIDTNDGTNADLVKEVRSCRGEYIRNFGQPPSGKSPQPESAPVVTSLVNGPIVGRITLVTLASMESLADKLGSADIACLTEPRIVDALFEQPGDVRKFLEAKQMKPISNYFR